MATEITDKEKVRQIWRASWTPPDRSPPWEWAENNINSIPYSPVPGRPRSANSPWIREPMELVQDVTRSTVICLAAIQAGKTTVAELSLCHIIKNNPGPALWLDQTDDDAKDQSESRLQKLFAECPPVRDLRSSNRHKTKNDAIEFANGMHLWVKGAHNKTNLQRRSIRWLIGDETWRWPKGHMAEAEARTTAFGWLGKRLFISQAGVEGDDTDLKWEMSDKREWHVKCQGCGAFVMQEWKDVTCDPTAQRADGQWDYARVKATTIWQCPHAECRHVHTDSDRTRRQLGTSGKFIPTNPDASGDVVGFHWNGMVSTSWGMLMELYLRARESARRGDNTALVQFYQKRLAIAWRDDLEDFKMDIERSSYDPLEPWIEEGAISKRGTLLSGPYNPDDAQFPLRFLTVDCQLDYFVALVRSFSTEGHSRFRVWKRLETWEEVEEFGREHGVSPALTFIDAGYRSWEVYQECAKRGWTALMGDKKLTYSHKVPRKNRAGRVIGTKRVQRFYSPKRTLALGSGKTCAMFYWSNLNIKDALARLRRNQDRANGVTWEVHEDVDADYLAQMDSETRVKKANGFMWERIGKRPNHIWDCEAMQIVAATMLKLIGRESIHEPEQKEGEAEPEEAADDAG